MSLDCLDYICKQRHLDKFDQQCEDAFCPDYIKFNNSNEENIVSIFNESISATAVPSRPPLEKNTTHPPINDFIAIRYDQFIEHFSKQYDAIIETNIKKLGPEKYCAIATGASSHLSSAWINVVSSISSVVESAILGSDESLCDKYISDDIHARQQLLVQT